MEMEKSMMIGKKSIAIKKKSKEIRQMDTISDKHKPRFTSIQTHSYYQAIVTNYCPAGHEDSEMTKQLKKQWIIIGVM